MIPNSHPNTFPPPPPPITQNYSTAHRNLSFVHPPPGWAPNPMYNQNSGHSRSINTQNHHSANFNQSFVHPPPGWAPNSLNNQNNDQFQRNNPENNQFQSNSVQTNFSTVVDRNALSINNASFDQNMSTHVPRTCNDNDSSQFITDGNDISWFTQPTLPLRGNNSMSHQLVSQIPIMAAHVHRQTSVDVSSTPIAQHHPYDTFSNPILNTPTRHVVPRPNQSVANWTLHNNESIGQTAFTNYANENPRRVRTNTTSAPVLSNIIEESITPLIENRNSTNGSNVILDSTQIHETAFENIQPNAPPSYTSAPPAPTAPTVPANPTTPVSTLPPPPPAAHTGVDPNILFLGSQMSNLVTALHSKQNENRNNYRQNTITGSAQIQQIEKIRSRICKINTPPILNKGTSIIVYLRLKFDRYRKSNLFSKFEVQIALGHVFLSWSDYMSDFVINMVKVNLADQFTNKCLTHLYRLISQKFSDNPNELKINSLQSGENVVDFFTRVLIVIEENKTHSGAFEIPDCTLNAYTLQRIISRENSIMNFADLQLLSSIISQTPEIREPGKLHLCKLERILIHEILQKFEFRRDFQSSTANFVGVNAVNLQPKPRQQGTSGPIPKFKVPPRSAFGNDCCDLCGRLHPGKCKYLQIFLKDFACDFCFKAVKPDQSFAYTIDSPEVRHGGMGCKTRTKDHPYPFPRKLQGNDQNGQNNQNKRNYGNQNGRNYGNQSGQQNRNYRPQNRNTQQVQQVQAAHDLNSLNQAYRAVVEPTVDTYPVQDNYAVVDVDLSSEAINSVPLASNDIYNLPRVPIPNTDITAYKSRNDGFLHLYPVFDNNTSAPVVVDTGCKPEGCIDRNLVNALKLNQYKSDEKTKIRTADNTIVGPYSVLNVPMKFGTQSVTLKLIELPACPCGILLGLPALKHLKTHNGENALVRIQEVLAEIETFSKNMHR